MERYSIRFCLGSTQYAFFPNQTFWATLLGGFFIILSLSGSMAVEYWETRQHYYSLHEQTGLSYAYTDSGEEELETGWLESLLNGASAVSASDSEAFWTEDSHSEGYIENNHFAPSILVAISALINALVRRLVNYLLKVNKVVLLTQSRFDEMQSKPVVLRLGSQSMQFTPSRRFWQVVLLIFLVPIGMMGYFYYSNQQMQERITLLELGAKDLDQLFESKRYKDDVMGFFIDYFKEYEDNRKEIEDNYRDAFMIQKQLIISKYLIREKVSRPEQLSSSALLEMNEQISKLFRQLILDKIHIEPHVHEYFTKESDLNKVETALMEQAKFHVPASIKLAQSALETAYGRRVVNNNYFGIKDKSNQSDYMTTTEYYNAKEVQLNKRKILSKQLVKKNGKMLYKCKVKDSFMEYKTPWDSFRAHSIYLANNKRYSPLFTKGKDYEAWADKIGSTKYGGVGYATSPIYGNLLKKIIKRYSLDLLDY